ncbi:Uncharacterized protein Fot_37324 [Forsythia ovata]|uniref:Uncharacterized protein n=1 Tax=Forsythia ovata TaxID=205694 RepID=A0ABD1S111_9LAMI
MDVSKLNSNVSALREELMACSFGEAIAVQTLLAAQKSLACLLVLLLQKQNKNASHDSEETVQQPNLQPCSFHFFHHSPITNEETVQQPHLQPCSFHFFPYSPITK